MTGTAYNAYLQAETLHSLQVPVTQNEGERSFLVVCQVQELYFALISHDIGAASDHLRKDALPDATASLQRAASHFAGLNASWRSLGWMLPADFAAIKVGMTKVHGKSTSLQSWKYREMLYRLGLKDASLGDEVATMPKEYAQLRRVLDAPSVYEEALALARRRGHDLQESNDDGVTDGEHPLDPAVVSFWTSVFTSKEPECSELLALARALIAVAEGLAEYKYLHYVTTSRTLGARPAHFGVSGTAWLTPTLTVMPFPELWATRTGGE
ncbi:tryptophan 2,3-dioxygenase family protein [Pedococcus sp. 5OH_020]|uniref:tryptophan 2,3-dioxygenase family protein n=1 Tax=Pedococcus sp. 5OH_020 TaxID=2989814 RepID=UPI0022E9A64F|nr:tryptophan 2,3-dioxygenase family protein [Pedococcus sp. 5OH_020]